MRRRLLFLFTLFIILTGEFGFAVDIPQDLSQSDRVRVTKLLGLNTSSKLLSNPYPLGGHQGFEVGVAYEVINIEDLARLGSKTDPQSELMYPRVSVGKGLYYNFDLFFHFIPPTTNNDIFEYGGIAKWSFFQGRFLPISLSAMLHASNVNISDSFLSRTLGAELVAGINVNDFALYFGGGPVSSQASFLVGNGAEGVVDPAEGVAGADRTVVEKVHQFHSYVGIHSSYEILFFAFQIDRYSDTVYSAKLGLRF